MNTIDYKSVNVKLFFGKGFFNLRDWTNLSLPFAYRGFDLRVVPQQGQFLPSHIM